MGEKNKGFSLVELIIVIAIMVVLVGVIAPQFVKYVRKSKIAVDCNNAAEIAEAVSVAIVEGDIDGDGVIKIGGFNIAEVQATPVPDKYPGHPSGRTFRVKGGSQVEGVSTMDALPLSKTQKDWYWYFEVNNDGIVMIGLDDNGDEAAPEIWPDPTAFRMEKMNEDAGPAYAGAYVFANN